MLGNIKITFQLTSLTGLHIGGQSTGLGKGPVDKTFIRDSLTGLPYIPGSSLKGKIRSLIERAIGSVPNKKAGRDVMIHECSQSPACPACKLFGVMAGNRSGAGTARVQPADAFLTKESEQLLLSSNTDTVAGEIKTEAGIDRVTSAANPRQVERVPAGAVFSAEIIFHVYNEEDIQLLNTLLAGLNLLQDSALGAAGSRGYGRVSIDEVTLVWKPIGVYAGEGEPVVLIQDQPIAEVVSTYE
jgi:CRISPR-associated protein Csm3